MPFDTSWTLSLVPDSSSVTVTVSLADGTTNTLSASDYTLSGATLSVSSSKVQQLVPEGSSITINYKSPTSLSTSFTLDSQYQLPSGADVVAKSAKVTITDVNSKDRVLNSGFIFNGTTVNFSSGKEPAAGESFTLSYKYYGDEITSYSYTRSGNTNASVALSCRNKSTSSMISCSYDATDQEVSFSNDSQFDGEDTIEITETLQPVGSGVTVSDFDLSSYDYAAGEAISIEFGGTTCSTTGSPPNMLTVSDDVIELADMSSSDCSIITSLKSTSNQNEKVIVKYKGYEDLPDDFLQMPKSFFAEHRGKYKFEYWEVKVGGVTTNDFVVDDYKITELNGVMTDNTSGMRDEFASDTDIVVIVRLYHAL